MCTVTNGFYCIEYEVLNGRKCRPGDVKDIALNFINHTGSLKYIIDISCQTRDVFIKLKDNGLSALTVVNKKVFLPPAYRKTGSIGFQWSQITEVFKADVASSANNLFKTVLHCEAIVQARANINDPDALKVISSHPKTYDFYPPLEATI
jgi:hypothetical protein